MGRYASDFVREGRTRGGAFDPHGIPGREGFARGAYRGGERPGYDTGLGRARGRWDQAISPGPGGRRAPGSYGGGSRGSWQGGYDRGFRAGYDRDLGGRVRAGWRELSRNTRRWFGGGRYDRGY